MLIACLSNYIQVIQHFWRISHSLVHVRLHVIHHIVWHSMSLTMLCDTPCHSLCCVTLLVTYYTDGVIFLVTIHTVCRSLSLTTVFDTPRHQDNMCCTVLCLMAIDCSTFFIVQTRLQWDWWPLCGHWRPAVRQQDHLCDCLRDTSASVLLVNALLQFSHVTLATVARPWAVVSRNTNWLHTYVVSVHTQLAMVYSLT